MSNNYIIYFKYQMSFVHKTFYYTALNQRKQNKYLNGQKSVFTQNIIFPLKIKCIRSLYITHTLLFIDIQEIYKIICDIISMNKSKTQKNIFPNSKTIPKCLEGIAIQVTLFSLILIYGL